jgi:DNA-binding MarR family transcriptional regulator
MGRDRETETKKLEPTTGFLLVRVAEAIDRRFVELLRQLDMRPRHLHVLRYLDAYGPMSQQELATGIRVDSGNLIDALDELQSEGLIHREVDQADRRRRQLLLTPTGVRRLRRGIAASEQAETEILGGLSRRELTALRRTAERVYQQARERSDPLSK